jgi:hypothetical protein
LRRRIFNSRFLPLLLLLASGCAGPHALRHSRAKYSEAYQITQNEQLLLNLVRLRYRDTPSFLEVSNLATQFAFDESLGLSGTLKENSNNFNILGLSASAGASERPTASYTPLQGAEFVTKLITPIEEETIVLLTRSGWKGERVFRIAVQSLNGLSNMRGASGPTPLRLRHQEIEETLRFMKLVRDLEDYSERRILRFNYEEVETPKSAAMPLSALTPDHAVEAAQNDLKIIHPHNQVSVRIGDIRSQSPEAEAFVSEELMQNFVAGIKRDGLPRPIRVKYDASEQLPGQPFGLGSPSPKAETESFTYELPPPDSRVPPFTVVGDDLLFLAAKRIHESDPNELNYIPCDIIDPDRVMVAGSSQRLVMTWDAEANVQMGALGVPDLAVQEGRYTLKIEPRSLLGAMYYLSHAIQVPCEHQMSGLVVVSTDEFGVPFDWCDVSGDLLHVAFSEDKPECAAVATKYRGYWFYIDDRDHSSKATFSLLMQLFELQAGGGTGKGPVLTLPVGI